MTMVNPDTVRSMVWPGGDQGYGGGQGPQDQGGWQGYPPGGQYPPNPPGGFVGSGGPMAFPPPPPRRTSAGIIVAVAVIMVVLVGAGVGVALYTKKDKKPVVAQSTQAAPTPSLGGPGPGSSASPPPANPTIPGWHAVVAVKHGVTYDAPPSWSVKTPDTIIGFGDSKGNPQVAGSGAATYKDGYCSGHPGSSRAQASVTGYVTTDPAADAKDAAQKWATYGYETDENSPAPSVTISGPTPMNAGGVQAQLATATVTVHDTANKCMPPRAIVHVVAVPTKDGKVAVLVVLADQGVADAAPDSDLQKIAATVRPTA